MPIVDFVNEGVKSLLANLILYTWYTLGISAALILIGVVLYKLKRK